MLCAQPTGVARHVVCDGEGRAARQGACSSCRWLRAAAGCGTSPAVALHISAHPAHPIPAQPTLRLPSCVVLCAGHSMGGGTAAMLTMMMREKVGGCCFCREDWRAHNAVSYLKL